MTIRTVDEELVERVALAIESADEDSGYDYDHLRLEHERLSDWNIHLALAAIEASGFLNRVERLEDALRCLLDRFIETEVEQGRDPKKQSEVILARAALTGEHNG